MRAPLALRGIKDIIWNPRSFFNELRTTPKMWPTIIVPFVTLVLIMLLWYHTTAEVIARGLVSSGNLSPIQLDFFEKFGPDRLIMALAKQQFVWFTGWSLIRLLFIAFIGYGLVSLKRGGQKFSQVLSFILYGEILYRIGDALTSLIIFCGYDSVMTFSLGGLLNKFITLTPNLSDLLALTDIFLIWEVVVVAVGYIVIFQLNRRQATISSVLSVCTPLVLKFLITIWVQS